MYGDDFGISVLFDEIRHEVTEDEWSTAIQAGSALTPKMAIEYARDEDEEIPKPTGNASLSSSLIPDEHHAKLAKLTVQEREFLPLVMQGMAYRQMANKLSISEATVATHLTNIRKKLGLKTTAAVAAFLHQIGWPQGSS